MSIGVEMTAPPNTVARRSLVSTQWTTRSQLLLLIALIGVFALSTNEYQIFYQTHTVAGKELISASQGVLSGHPPWRAFQARLLGPLAFAAFETCIDWGRSISQPAYSAFERIFSLPDTRDLAKLNGFVSIMILIKDLVCFGLLLRYSGSLVKAAGGTVLGAILFVLLSHYWLYTWDLFELIFFTSLAFMMFRYRKISRAS
jgi:hypothetical protein